MRAVGFVVGHTNWDRMMDPTKGGSALTRTKYIWFKLLPKHAINDKNKIRHRIYYLLLFTRFFFRFFFLNLDSHLIYINEI